MLLGSQHFKITSRRSCFSLFAEVLFNPQIKSQLIGSAEARASLRTEQEQQFKESLAHDEKKEKTRHLEELMEKRRSKLAEEPSLQEDHIVIRIRHPTLGEFQYFYKYIFLTFLFKLFLEQQILFAIDNLKAHRIRKFQL